MSIISVLFLFLFLPLALTVYYIADDKAKEYVLLVISLFFYALGCVNFIVPFIAAVVVTVLHGRLISLTPKRVIKKIFLVTGIVFNTGLLFYFKYFNFTLEIVGRLASKEAPSVKKILLPWGISFYSFKAISYLIDVYSGKAVLDENPVHDALYLSIFTQIQSGPISRYNEMHGNPAKIRMESAVSTQGGKQYKYKQFSKQSSILFSDGVYRFLIGFNKKVLIANVLANITSEIFGTPIENLSTSYAWLGSVCYSLQLFFDFAGYSDMAIGLTEMFGYKCRENFDYPYMTESVAKFWRRWHISLGDWFRDYIYIPMGGSRDSQKWKVYFNLLVVWILTGIWHGAAWNFVLWGLGYFVLISFERLTGLPEKIASRTAQILYRIPVLLFINFQWVLFNSDGIVRGLRYIKRMILFYPNTLSDQRTRFLIKDYSFFIIMAVVLCFPVIPWIEKKLSVNESAAKIYNASICIVTTAAFLWAVSFVVAGQNNPFAYANF